ncbi:MAG: hypothetical protein H7175_12875 [Burkholderiales bacterium]|nr:hypothetical protein [Anaerolineae bacterium]
MQTRIAKWAFTSLSDWDCVFVTPHTLERCIHWLNDKQEDPNNESPDKLTVEIACLNRDTYSILAYKSDRFGSNVRGLLERIDSHATTVSLRGEIKPRAMKAGLAPIGMAVVALVFGIKEGREAAIFLSLMFGSILPLGLFVQHMKQRAMIAQLKGYLCEDMLLRATTDAQSATDHAMNEANSGSVNGIANPA